MFGFSRKRPDYLTETASNRTTLVEPVQLSCILHFLARRGSDDDGFVLTTRALSESAFVFVSPARLSEGQALSLKIVSGARHVDVTGVVARLEEAPRGYCRGEIAFVDLGSEARTLIVDLIRRFSAIPGTRAG